MQEELLLEILNVVKRSETENKKAIEELKADLKEFKEETRVAINRLEEKVDKLETRFDGLEEKVDKLEARFDGLEEKVNGLETKADRLDVKTDRIEKQITDEMEDTPQMLKILFEQTDKITNYVDLTWKMKKIN